MAVAFIQSDLQTGKISGAGVWQLVFGCALPPSSPWPRWITGPYCTSGVPGPSQERSADGCGVAGESPHQARALMAELPDTDVLRAGTACHRRLRWRPLTLHYVRLTGQWATSQVTAHRWADPPQGIAPHTYTPPNCKTVTPACIKTTYCYAPTNIIVTNCLQP